ncbi:MAG: hypothetical protein RLZZ511_4189 [Cyanobacteriota bacterium]
MGAVSGVDIGALGLGIELFILGTTGAGIADPGVAFAPDDPEGMLEFIQESIDGFTFGGLEQAGEGGGGTGVAGGTIDIFDEFFGDFGLVDVDFLEGFADVVFVLDGFEDEPADPVLFEHELHDVAQGFLGGRGGGDGGIAEATDGVEEDCALGLVGEVDVGGEGGVGPDRVASNNYGATDDLGDEIVELVAPEVGAVLGVGFGGATEAEQIDRPYVKVGSEVGDVFFPVVGGCAEAVDEEEGRGGGVFTGVGVVDGVVAPLPVLAGGGDGWGGEGHGG